MRKAIARGLPDPREEPGEVRAQVNVGAPVCCLEVSMLYNTG